MFECKTYFLSNEFEIFLQKEPVVQYVHPYISFAQEKYFALISFHFVISLTFTARHKKHSILKSDSYLRTTSSIKSVRYNKFYNIFHTTQPLKSTFIVKFLTYNLFFDHTHVSFSNRTTRTGK